MKDYDETIQSIFEKGDGILAARKKRKALIRRITLSVSGICAAVLIGVGIRSSDALKNGWKDDFGSDNFIAGTTATTAQTTASGSTATVLTAEQTTSTETTSSTSATAVTSTQTDTARSSANTTSEPVRSTTSQVLTTSTSYQTAAATTTSDISTTTTGWSPPAGGASPPPTDTTAASSVTTTTISIPPHGDRESSWYFACIPSFVSTLSYAPDIPVTYNAVERMNVVPECSELYEIPNLVTDSAGELRMVTMHIFVFTEISEEIAVAVRFNDTPEFYLYTSTGS